MHKYRFLSLLLIAALQCFGAPLKLQSQSHYEYSHHVFFDHYCPLTDEQCRQRIQQKDSTPYNTTFISSGAVAMMDTNKIVMNIYDSVSKSYQLAIMDWNGKFVKKQIDKYGYVSKLYYNTKRSLLYAYYADYNRHTDYYIMYDSALNVKDSIVTKVGAKNNWLVFTGMINKKEDDFLKKCLSHTFRKVFIHDYPTDYFSAYWYISFINEDYIVFQDNQDLSNYVLDRKKLFRLKPKKYNARLTVNLYTKPFSFYWNEVRTTHPIKNCPESHSSLGKAIRHLPQSNVAIYGKYLVATYRYIVRMDAFGRDYVSFHKMVP